MKTSGEQKRRRISAIMQALDEAQEPMTTDELAALMPDSGEAHAIRCRVNGDLAELRQRGVVSRITSGSPARYRYGLAHRMPEAQSDEPAPTDVLDGMPVSDILLYLAARTERAQLKGENA